MNRNEDPYRPVVHWFSPLPPAATDIANYTARVLPFLAKVARVVLWTDAHQWDTVLERYAIVRNYSAKTLTVRALSNAAQAAGAPKGVPQANFFHIGNNWKFHWEPLCAIRRCPGIVVLHDVSFQYLLNDAILHHDLSLDQYLEMIRSWYGDDGCHRAKTAIENQTVTELHADIAGFELVVGSAHSVLTHGPFATRIFNERLPIPVNRLELPFSAGEEPYLERPRHGPLRLLQFGYLGTSRRVIEILEALAELRECIEFRFDIFGKIDPSFAFSIRQKTVETGLEERVRIRGFVPEQVLDAELRQAHLVFNLHVPSMSAASSSQLRIWKAGAASAATNVGWRSSLPKDTVFHVPAEPQQEKEAIQSIVRRLWADRSVSQSHQKAGRRRLIEQHHPRDYAQGIAELTKKSAGYAAKLILCEAFKRGIGINTELDRLQVNYRP
ncbi:MAG: glycosyltransferase family 1 protein [Aestuariivita sp.]|nr:glycosyltransferase family 1 protein [Aestuariivita sp.]MCY4202794.1 glycosyltransferase family 1 protein [Aestuariivita sp.]